MLDFKKPKNQKNNDSEEAFYDIIDDYALIEASFAQQYGIRLRTLDDEDMETTEFLSLLAGLNYKTPLGSVVAIRSESDPDMLKQFTAEQKKIRNDWKQKHSTLMNKEDAIKKLNELEKFFSSMQ